MAEDNKNLNEEISQDVIDLVIARLKTIPSDATLSIGGDKEGFSISELIERVQAGDEIGRKIIQSQLHFLRSLKDLPIEEYDASDH
jgi:hypothetical protein